MKVSFGAAIAAASALISVAPSAQAAPDVSKLDPRAREQLLSALYALRRQAEAGELNLRSAPSGDYAPSAVDCPTPPANNETAGLYYIGQLRNASSQALNPDEAAYVAAHRAARQQDWTKWLQQEQVGLDGDVPGGFSNYTGGDLSRVPRVAIATSGGGYRAMLYGAGVFSALDNRNETATRIGTGGILQLADYIAGLSGGSWLTGSVAINDYPTTQALHDNIWDLESNLIVPDNGAISFYADIVAAVAEKRAYTGSSMTGITDYWGRALSYHLINDTMYPNHGLATTWSDVRNVSNYVSHAYPFPIIISDQRNPADLFITLTSPIWEYTPYEAGTWNPDIEAFIDIDLIGTPLTNGNTTQSDGKCTAGWDNAGWIMGTSSTLFNGLFTMLVTSQGDSVIKQVIEEILGAIARQYNDVSLIPNYVNGYRSDSNVDAASPNISLVDGGEDGQNVPLWPVISPARDVDFILALDSSADETSWPNGTSLVATSQRVQNATYAQWAFPDIPSQNTFVNLGLNTRPVFFGCPGANITNANTSFGGKPSPLVAYIPNYPYEYLANVSTFQLEYTNAESQGVMDNAFAVATLGASLNGSALISSTLSWPKCIACGMLLRSFQRSGTAIPSACTACFDAYCWDGTRNDTAPANAYSPPVGPPEWVTSSAALVREAPYTGGNGSSPANPAGSSSSSGATSSSGSANNTNAAPRAGGAGALVILAAVAAAALALL